MAIIIKLTAITKIISQIVIIQIINQIATIKIVNQIAIIKIINYLTIIKINQIKSKLTMMMFSFIMVIITSMVIEKKSYLRNNSTKIIPNINNRMVMNKYNCRIVRRHQFVLHVLLNTIQP